MLFRSNPLYVKPARLDKQLFLDSAKTAREEHRKLDSRALRTAVKEHVEQRRRGVVVCSVCTACADEEAGVKLMACSKCRQIGRKVWYCSK